MITEDYVNFETAKLLKEKGFDEECFAYYYVMPHKTVIAYDKDFPKNSDLSLIYTNLEFGSLPTLQMAMKWLREEHNLHIIALPYAPIDRPPYHPGEADVVYIGQIFKGIIPIDEVGRSIIKLSPEEAYQVSIQYCLENLI